MNDTKLENYLYSLDKALEGIAVSEKAEIITEIKSHVLSALEKNPSANLEAVLNSLGEPKQVASRYLLERDLKPHKYKLPLNPIVKWLVIGFLGTLMIVILSGSLLVWKLNPSFNFDGKTGNIEMLHGAVQIHYGASDDDISVKYLSVDKPNDKK